MFSTVATLFVYVDGGIGIAKRPTKIATAVSSKVLFCLLLRRVRHGQPGRRVDRSFGKLCDAAQDLGGAFHDEQTSIWLAVAENLWVEGGIGNEEASLVRSSGKT